jgi:hypothetical protein
MKDHLETLITIAADIFVFSAVLIPVSILAIKTLIKIVTNLFSEDSFIFIYTPICFIAGILTCLYAGVASLKIREV